jgi:hypothetical protein
MRVATSRATMSVAPPGAKGTIKVMGRVGNGACCACTAGRTHARQEIARVMPTSERAIPNPRIFIALQPHAREPTAANKCLAQSNKYHTV